MAKKQVMRNDGYYDAFCRSGIQQYVNTNSYYEGKADDNTLTLMYRNSLVRKIVCSPIDDCVKNWLTIEGDEKNLIVQEMETIGAERAFVEAGYWDRLFGRSCIFMVIDDGGNAEDEVDLTKMRSIKALEVFDKRDIFEDTSKTLINDDPNDMNFGKPEYYQILPPNAPAFWVHHSRLLMFDGETLPRRERIQNNGAGLSCLDGVIGAIRRSDTAQARAYDIVERLSTSMLKLDGLSQMLQTETGTQMVQARLNLIDLARNMLNTVAIDRDDDFQIYNMSIGGVQGIIQEFEQTISGYTGIPMTILFGRSPGGMNSTGAADFENYYNLVRRYQKTKMKPQLETLVKYIQLCKNGPFKGKELDSWSIKFNELQQQTELEVAQTEASKLANRKGTVELIQMLMDMQELDAEEARQYLLKQDYPVTKHKIDLSDQEQGDNPMAQMQGAMGGGMMPPAEGMPTEMPPAEETPAPTDAPADNGEQAEQPQDENYKPLHFEGDAEKIKEQVENGKE